MATFTFIDTATIQVTAGNGGKGCRSFQREPGWRHKRPDGGDGGDGGSVVLVADVEIMTLLDCAYRKHYTAGHGRHGGSSGKQGARGAETRVLVPAGTVVHDAETGYVLRDLDRPGEEMVAARGGRGGRGNMNVREATSGTAGEDRKLRLELKLIADVGLVGLPNAGKSSLIRQMSHATPRVAAYPFTTKSPVLGVVTVPDTDIRFTACDIPGLIEGAHAGRGLGLTFLRHVERTKILVYVLDMAGSEGRAPQQDWQTLRAELAAYDAQVGDKPRLVVANKMDLSGAAEQCAAFRRACPSEEVHAISCATGDGVPALIEALWRRINTVTVP